ncbi:hypothetical protein Tco_1354871 [Tanacetum coccineum]
MSRIALDGDDDVLDALSFGAKVLPKKIKQLVKGIGIWASSNEEIEPLVNFRKVKEIGSKTIKDDIESSSKEDKAIGKRLRFRSNE